MWKILCLSAAALSCVVLPSGVAAADRPELAGTWQLDATHSQIGDPKLKDMTWSITQKDDSIVIAQAVTDTGGKEKKCDIQCGTEGAECKIKEWGQPTQVTLYYNGPALVMLEQSHGTDFVTKKRLLTSADGKTLTVEVQHIAPPGHKDEVWKFVEAVAAATEASLNEHLFVLRGGIHGGLVRAAHQRRNRSRNSSGQAVHFANRFQHGLLD